MKAESRPDIDVTDGDKDEWNEGDLISPRKVTECKNEAGVNSIGVTDTSKRTEITWNSCVPQWK